VCALAHIHTLYESAISQKQGFGRFTMVNVSVMRDDLLMDWWCSNDRFLWRV
jgi:hypothetical protein